MSRTDVDVVRAAFAAFYRGDLPAMLELTAPDIVVRQFPDQLDVRDYHGHEGSGVPMEGEVTFVFTVRQGTIARWQMFRSGQEALAVLGLTDS